MVIHDQPQRYRNAISLVQLLMLLIGGALALVIRTELFQPGLQFIEPAFFNQMTTNHGLIMVFSAIMPAFVGLANWLIPMQVGALTGITADE